VEGGQGERDWSGRMKRITKPHWGGELIIWDDSGPFPVRSLKHLVLAIEKKKAVIVPNTVWAKPKPAAVMINLPGAILYKLFEKGMYIYEKPKDKKHG
jgi:hypothetical protein